MSQKNVAPQTHTDDDNGNRNRTDTGMYADPSTVDSGYAKYVLTVLIVIYMFNFIDRQILSILANDIKADLGISDAEIGFLYGTAFAVFYAIFGIPLGRLSDLWVRKRVIATGLGFWSLMTALSGFARNFGMLSTFRIGVGVGEASAGPAAYSMIADYFKPAKRATAMALYSSGIYIGSGIAYMIGGPVLDTWKAWYPDPSLAPLGLAGWQVAFLAVGIPGILMAFWVNTLKEPIRGMSEGVMEPAPLHPHPFKTTFTELLAIFPGINIVSLVAGKARNKALKYNACQALALATVALVLVYFTNMNAPLLSWPLVAIAVYTMLTIAQALLLSLSKRHSENVQPGKVFAVNLFGALIIALVAYACFLWAESATGNRMLPGNIIQWSALGVGVYCAFTWAQSMSIKLPEVFRTMFRTPTLVLVGLAFPIMSFVTYGTGFWAIPHVQRTFEVSNSEVGMVMGLTAAGAGLMGVAFGGWLADKLRKRFVSGRMIAGIVSGVGAVPTGLMFLYSDDIVSTYIWYFIFVFFKPIFLGPSYATVTDLVPSHMRGMITAVYLMLMTFIGLALGPHVMGVLSASYSYAGMGSAEALQTAVAWPFILYGVGIALAFMACFTIKKDEARFQTAQA